MQLFVLHQCPKKAAKLLCNAHVCSQARETTQILYTLLWLWGVTPAGPVPCGDLGERDVYKPAYVRHPCVLWAASCQKAATWVLEHAKAIVREYSRRAGGRRHLCEYHIKHCRSHVAQHGWPSGMPKRVAADAWLATLDDKTRAAVEWRVASKNPPKGCAFGVLAMDMVGPRRGEPDDCVAAYTEYYTYKALVFKKAMDRGAFKSAKTLL